MMTSRERVRAMLNKGKPDRVPIDIGGSIVTGIHMDEYIDISNYIGVANPEVKVYDQFQMLARIDENMRKWLHSDVIELENDSVSWGIKNEGWKPWKNMSGQTVLMPDGFEPVYDESGYAYLYDENGDSLARMAPDSKYFDRYAEKKNLRSFDVNPISPEEWKKQISLYADEELRCLEKRAKKLYEETEYSIFGGFNKGKLGTTGVFAGYDLEEWFYILMVEPEYAIEMFEATAEVAIENLKLYLEAVGDYIDVLLMSTSDYGTQRAPMIGPEVFEKVYVPNYRLINNYLHEHSNVKSFFHSCGSVNKLIPGFIDAHVDILNPLQISADDMDIVEIKKNYGDKIMFWGGGADTQYVLPNGTKEEVREHVKHNLNVLKEGGGYVFATVHNIQAMIPPENIETMIEVVLEYGKY